LKQKKWKILICLIWGFLLKNQNTKRDYDRLSDWNQGMTNKREHRDSCNYVRVTWASDPRMRREEKNVNNCDWSESESSRIECSAGKVKRRFSGWAALILTHGQVHFIYYKLRAHSNTHTHAQIHTHTHKYTLSLSMTSHTCITTILSSPLLLRPFERTHSHLKHV